MENNFEKDLKDFGGQAQSTLEGLTKMIDVLKNDLTPEQKAQVDEKIKSADFSDVMSKFDSIQKEMANFHKTQE